MSDHDVSFSFDDLCKEACNIDPNVVSNGFGLIHKVDLGGDVLDNTIYYQKLFELLRSVDKTDIVEIYMSNKGGDVETADHIVEEIKRCKAKTVSYVRSNCYSAGAIIAVSTNQLVMAKNRYLMFHHYSGGIEGKGFEQETSMKNFNKFWLSILKSTCQPFLTDLEVSTILKDNDIYVCESDRNFKQRCKRHFLTERGSNR